MLFLLIQKLLSFSKTNNHQRYKVQILLEPVSNQEVNLV